MKHILFTLLVACTLTSYATPVPIIPTKQEIHTLIQTPEIKKLSIGDKIAYFSRLFIDGKYAARMEWEPLGEGKYCDYNCKPLFRLDAFDCMTFVEMMLALATTDTSGDENYTFKNFQQQVIEIRYKSPDKISYLTRNHFPETDWMPHNTREGGLLTDMTGGIGLNPIETPPAVINKKNWYAHKKLSDICIWDDICSAPESEQKEKLKELRKAGKDIPNETVTLFYIPIKDILESKKDPLKEIPNGTIVQFIRPNWDAGNTHMHVIHEGIIVQDKEDTWLHHASSRYKEMQRVSFLKYLEAHQVCNERSFETCLAGINLLKPVL